MATELRNQNSVAVLFTDVSWYLPDKRRVKEILVCPLIFADSQQVLLMESIIRQHPGNSEFKFFHFRIASDDYIAREAIKVVRPVMKNIVENHY